MDESRCWFREHRLRRERNDTGRSTRRGLFRLTRLVLLFVVFLASNGCCTLETAFHRLGKWNKNVCGCTSDRCCEQHAQVCPPDGYLSDGPTIQGENMAGVAGRSSLESVIELREEIVQLEQENKALQKDLEAAADTIDQQELAIQAASQELQEALGDYLSLKRQYTQWQSDLSELEQEYRGVQQEQGSTLDELESRLEEILSQFESDPEPASVSLQSPRNQASR